MLQPVGGTVRFPFGRFPGGRYPSGWGPARRGVRLAALLAVLVLLGGGRGVDANQAVNDAVNAGVRGARRACGSIGVHVVDLTTGRSVYEYNADSRRIIASNTKLFTSAAALDRLGPGHFFETEVLVAGRIQDGVLYGDLAVVGGGDPNISGRHYQGDAFAIFRRWAAQLESQGIRRIEGDLVLVHGLFDGPYVHPDWPRDQLDKWYEAPVAALSFADSCALVKIWPNGGNGSRAQVDVLPRVGMFSVETTATTTSSSRNHKVGVRRANGEDKLTVWGAVYKGGQPVDAWVAVNDPVKYFGRALERSLSEEGIEISGELRLTPQLPSAVWKPVAVHRTDLMTTLEVVNKRSQNFYAESVLKLMGARSCGRGSWESGVRVVSDFLHGMGIDPDEYSMVDGSGMSRNNQFTPRQVTTLLSHMFTHRYGGEFVRTLPYSGEEGLSWEKRLADDPYRGNVFAKTGRLRGVSALSGYAKAASGRVYAFSVLCNSSRGDWGAKEGQDDIVRAIIRNG